MPTPKKLEDVVLIPFDKLTPSPTNPRKTFDPDEMEKLTKSIKAVGVLEPAVVRKVGPGEFEVLFGERRMRAAKKADLDGLPCIVREMSDQEIVEAQLVENDQREGVHPIEQAEAYQVLMRAPHMLSVHKIAARIGRPVEKVKERLRLLALSPACRKACLAGKLSIDVALLVARIPGDELQEECLAAITQGEEPMSKRVAGQYIQRRYMLTLSGAPFATNDDTLVPLAGSCAKCPKRTGSQPDLFADVQDRDTCTDRVCFELKKTAAWERSAERARNDGHVVLSRDEAAAVLGPSGHPRTRELIVVADTCSAVEGEKTWQHVLGDKAPKRVIARSDDGAVVEMFRREDVDAVLTSMGIEPEDVEEDADKRDATRKKKLLRKIIGMALDKLVALVEDLEINQVWVALAFANDDLIGSESLKRRAMTEEQAAEMLKSESTPASWIAGFAFECIISRHAWNLRDGVLDENFRAICDRMAVSLDDISKQLETEELEKEREKSEKREKTAAKAAAKEAAAQQTELTTANTSEEA